MIELLVVAIASGAAPMIWNKIKGSGGGLPAIVGRKPSKYNRDDYEELLEEKSEEMVLFKGQESTRIVFAAGRVKVGPGKFVKNCRVIEVTSWPHDWTKEDYYNYLNTEMRRGFGKYHDAYIALADCKGGRITYREIPTAKQVTYIQQPATATIEQRPEV